MSDRANVETSKRRNVKMAPHDEGNSFEVLTFRRFDVSDRERAPSADEIEEQLRSIAVLALRPVVWAGVGILSVLRQYSWSGYFECDLMRLEGPLMFAANHRSHADTAAILDTMPPKVCKNTVVAAALDVFGPDTRNGARRKWSKSALQLITAAGFHAFAFDRHGPPLRSVRTSTQLIKSGWHLLLYPEGTRSRSGEIAAFKPGVGVLAKFTGRPVIPVHVDGGERILPYSTFLPGAGHARVRYGEPMFFRKGETPAEFTQRLELEVRQLALRQAQTKAAAKVAAITIQMAAATPLPVAGREQTA
jgi:1-acyl-sn-glycerol-3-phosphate acyltransferase